MKNLTARRGLGMRLSVTIPPSRPPAYPPRRAVVAIEGAYAGLFGEAAAAAAAGGNHSGGVDCDGDVSGDGGGGGSRGGDGSGHHLDSSRPPRSSSMTRVSWEPPLPPQPPSRLVAIEGGDVSPPTARPPVAYDADDGTDGGRDGVPPPQPALRHAPMDIAVPYGGREDSHFQEIGWAPPVRAGEVDDLARPVIDWEVGVLAWPPTAAECGAASRPPPPPSRRAGHRLVANRPVRAVSAPGGPPAIRDAPPPRAPSVGCVRRATRRGRDDDGGIDPAEGMGGWGDVSEAPPPPPPPLPPPLPPPPSQSALTSMPSPPLAAHSSGATGTAAGVYESLSPADRRQLRVHKLRRVRAAAAIAAAASASSATLTADGGEGCDDGWRRPMAARRNTRVLSSSMDSTPVGTPRGGMVGGPWVSPSPSGTSEPSLGGVLSVLSTLGVDGAEPIDEEESADGSHPPGAGVGGTGSTVGEGLMDGSARPSCDGRKKTGGGDGSLDGGGAGSSSAGDPYPTPEVDSRERKLIRNRLAALKSRQAAKARRASAEADHSALVRRVRSLLARNEGLRVTASGGGVVEELAAAYAACATAMEMGLA
ncbi:hypothetical protein MMPV_010147 [Pyropia vietnamensis]